MPSKPRSLKRRLATSMTFWRFSAAWARLTRIVMFSRIDFNWTL